MSGRLWFGMGLLIALMGLGAGMSDPAISNYRFPMAGSEAILSGNFGELRSNHFHSGIDVKTGGEIGKNLYAAREGYIYRLKVSPYGFGKAIYLRHPDGEFTVYAHLSGFTPAIEEYIYQKQYASKRYEQEIYLPEDEITVKKGELIAYSGNSGSSGGPHLHFEIRDPEERIMNVLAEYKNLIRDNTRPVVQRIGFQAQDAGSTVNGQFTKVEIVPDGNNGSYSIPGVQQFRGRVGIEYQAYDLLDAAYNHCGVNYARLYLDGEEIYSFTMDKFGFDEKKYINVHFDYPHWKRTGRKIQKAYIDDGNKLPCYESINRGFIDLKDDRIHNIRLELSDTHGNESTIRMQARRGQQNTLPQTVKFPGATNLNAYRRRNLFVVEVSNPSNAHLRGIDVTYTNGETVRIQPASLVGNQLVYLLDLERWRLPESFRDPITGKTERFDYRETILPDKNNIVELEELKLYFPYSAVFDSLPLHLRSYPGNRNMYSDIYEVGSQSDPLFKSFVLNMKPSRKGNPNHMVMAYKHRSGTWRYLGKELNEDGTIYASSGTFGTFCVMADSTVPRISPSNLKDGATIGSGQKNLRLRITDNFSGIDSERILGTIDGRWVLFEYDAKTASITHRLRNRPAAGKHDLKIMVYDNANNMAEETFTLYF